LKQPPYQKEWKEINLAATVPGWNRYWFADQMLQDVERNRQAVTGAASGARLIPTSPTSSSSVNLNDPLDRREYNEFLEWKRRQQKQ
jgi:hypothetical protein